MNQTDQPTYPLLEALLRIKGLTLQATYTNADVAALFNASVRTIQNWAADGRLTSRKLIGNGRYLPTDLEAYFQNSKE